MLPAIQRGKSLSHGNNGSSIVNTRSPSKKPRHDRITDSPKDAHHRDRGEHKEASQQQSAAHSSHHVALSYSPISTLQTTGTGSTVRLPSSILNNQSHAATMATHPHQTGYGYSTLLAARSEDDTSALSPPHDTRTLHDLHSPPHGITDSNINNNMGSPSGPAPRLFVFGPTNVVASSAPSAPVASPNAGFRTSLPRRTMRASSSHGVLPGGGAGPPPIVAVSSSPKNRTLSSSNSSSSLPHARSNRQSAGHISSHATSSTAAAASSSSSSSSVSAPSSSTIHHVVAPSTVGIMLPSAPMGGTASRNVMPRISPASEPSAAAKRYAGKKKANGGRIEPLGARASTASSSSSSSSSTAAASATPAAKANGNNGVARRVKAKSAKLLKKKTDNDEEKEEDTSGGISSLANKSSIIPTNTASSLSSQSSSAIIGPDLTSTPITASNNNNRRHHHRRRLPISDTEPVWCRLAARHDGSIALKWRADAEDTDSDDDR